MKTLYCKTLQEWRSWLKLNHDRASDIWLIFYKKEAGQPSVSYSDALDEALCYGWVDSVIKKIDEEKYARKFTPRKPESKWSDINKEKAKRLIAAKRMTRWGMSKIDAARENGMWDKPARLEISLEIPRELRAALKSEPVAEAFFDTLAPSNKRRYIAWIVTAKRPETKANRIEKSIKLLKEKKSLGLV
jgi:uncharacterized protein YdeI (YjbR/CyaY-like superfamily)